MSDRNSPSEAAGPRVGSEVDIGIFSRIQQLLASVRLTQDERVIVPTGDLAGDVHTARKEFEMDHVEETFRVVNRVANGFDQKVAQWESQARRKESQKQKMSMLEIRMMTAEHSGVRTRVELVRAQLRRLRVGLDQIVNAVDRTAVPPTEAEPPAATEEDASPLPPGFRAAFEAAEQRDAREAVIRQYFEVEAELAAEFKTVHGRSRVSFQPFPVPPLDRLYYLRETAQIVLARRLTAKMLHGLDPQAGQAVDVPVKDFVQHVRQGVWLLRPKPPAT